MKNLKEALKELQEEKPGLWANIRAKRARGEKPAHKNSNAHKDAVKAGKKINKMNEEGAEYDGIIGGIVTRLQDLKKYVSKKEPGAMEDLQKVMRAFEIFDEKMAYGAHAELEEGQDWPKEVPSRHGDIIFKLIKVMPDRAKYALIDAETGKEWEPGGRVFGSIASLMASAEDTIMPQGGRQSTHLGEDKSDAVRWFGNVKYYYTKAFVELKGEDKQLYIQMLKDYFSKL